jgi:hypothetical protein
MKTVNLLLLLMAVVFDSAVGQFSFDIYKGVNVGKDAGIATAICICVLGFVIGLVNVVRWKCIRGKRL